MQCPNCQHENRDSSKFCQQCGSLLTSGQQQPSITPEPAPWPEEPTRGRTAPVPKPYTPDAYRPAQPARPSSPAPPLSSPANPYSGNPYHGASAGPTAGSAAFNIWGPFAGLGSRGRHSAWLLDNLGQRAQELVQNVSNRFQERSIPDTQIGWRQLTGQGVLVEQRRFFFLRRGITTLALYVNQHGRDLYISIVTYVKGPISNVRVAILALMLLFQLFFMFGFTNTATGLLNNFSSSLFGGYGGSSAGALLPILLCCIGPLGVVNTMALVIGLIASTYAWLKNKDFLSLLRTPPNEFQVDDIIALEKSVEETVRQSLDAIGIDADLMTEATRQSFDPIRLI